MESTNVAAPTKKRKRSFIVRLSAFIGLTTIVGTVATVLLRRGKTANS